jgi:CRP-like cAMP-binding protein
MPSTNGTNRPAENRLLGRVSAEDLRRLRPALQPVRLEQGQVLREAGQPMSHVYFVDSGMVSVVSLMENGDSIEVATIGAEGAAGLAGLLEAGGVPYRHTVQVAGEARRFSTDLLMAEFRHDGLLRQMLLRYQAAFLIQIMQGVACNGLHSVEQRCCRWLLTTQDRVGSPELAITHDFLAQMLGVRRASVTDVLGPLQASGLIRATRGKVTIVDPERLVASSCECYRVIHREYQRLLA